MLSDYQAGDSDSPPGNIPDTRHQAIAFVDLETTGGNATHDRITEIGVVEVGPAGVEQWSALVDPEQPIPPFIQQLTGIDNDMVRGQPIFSSLAESLAERLRGKLFVAHNARFDYGFLKNEFARVGMRFRADVLCTVRLSRALFPSAQRHGLDSLIERFGLEPSGRHRALADAELLWQFWQKIHQLHPAEKVAAAARSLIRPASLPQALPDGTLASIPEAPGVYVLYGENDVPLYVGKSVNLKQRVGAHFSCDSRSTMDLRLSHEFRRIEWRQTAGEIGALLQHARLAKTLMPTQTEDFSAASQNPQSPAWPYPCPIAVVEHRTRATGDDSPVDAVTVSQWHVIDNWCYLGTADSHADIPAVLELMQPAPAFAHDVHGILSPWLAAGKLETIELREAPAFSLVAAPVSQVRVAPRRAKHPAAPRSENKEAADAQRQLSLNFDGG